MKTSTIKGSILILLVGFLSISHSFSQQNNEGLVKYVKPEIGLDNGGNVIPGPNLQFGLVKLGPDSEGGSNSGYISGKKINGFSHTHVSGTGSGAKYGNVTIAPVVGEFDITNYRSNGLDEKISAGYYKVHLDKWKVDAELTTSYSVGISSIYISSI